MFRSEVAALRALGAAPKADQDEYQEGPRQKRSSPRGDLLLVTSDCAYRYVTVTVVTGLRQDTPALRGENSDPPCAVQTTVWRGSPVTALAWAHFRD